MTHPYKERATLRKQFQIFVRMIEQQALRQFSWYFRVYSVNFFWTFQQCWIVQKSMSYDKRLVVGLAMRLRIDFQRFLQSTNGILSIKRDESKLFLLNFQKFKNKIKELYIE